MAYLLVPIIALFPGLHPIAQESHTFVPKTLGPYNKGDQITIAPHAGILARIEGSPGERYVVHGKKRLGPFSDVANLTLSYAGDHVAFAAKTKDSYLLGHDDRNYAPGPHERLSTRFRLSPDGTQLLYGLLSNDDSVRLMVGTQEIAKGRELRGWSFLRNAQVAYSRREDTGVRVVAGPWTSELFDDVSGLNTWGDGTKLSYSAFLRGAGLIFAAGDPIRVKARVVDYALDEEGRAAAYVLHNGAQAFEVVARGKSFPTKKQPEFLKVSANGQSFACVFVHPDGYQVGWDGSLGKVYEAIGPPVLSKDGQSLAYWAREEDESILVVGKQEFARYKDFGAPTSATIDWDRGFGPFLSAGSSRVAYAAPSGNELHWIVAIIERAK